MMATTHALAGAALAAGVTVVAPDLGPAALVGGLVGGAFPDADLYRDHRRRLHFPTYYTLAAAVAVAVAALATGPWTVGLATGLTAAALHARMDRYGGGLELRPWLGTADRAVYDHARGRWREPKRWVGYDGSPGDLALATALGVPAAVVFTGPGRSVVLAALAVSAVYVALRRRLPDVAERLAAALPPTVQAHVPERFLT